MYTKKSINAAIDATSTMCFVLHVTGEEYCDAVAAAMQISHDQQGVLSESDKEMITSLMP
jgi:hypothetical protein